MQGNNGLNPGLWGVLIIDDFHHCRLQQINYVVVKVVQGAFSGIHLIHPKAKAPHMGGMGLII